jgi:hypothetical protein
VKACIILLVDLHSGVEQDIFAINELRMILLLHSLSILNACPFAVLAGCFIWLAKPVIHCLSRWVTVYVSLVFLVDV